MTQLYTMVVRMKKIDRTPDAAGKIIETVTYREHTMTMLPLQTCTRWKEDMPESVVSIIAEEGTRDYRQQRKSLPAANGYNDRKSESQSRPPRAKSRHSSPPPSTDGTYAGAINNAIGAI